MYEQAVLDKDPGLESRVPHSGPAHSGATPTRTAGEAGKADADNDRCSGLVLHNTSVVLCRTPPRSRRKRPARRQPRCAELHKTRVSLKAFDAYPHNDK